jgi:uncharacterized protein (DUF433 family)
MSTKDARAPQESNGVPPADRARIVSTPGTCGGRPRIDGHPIWYERMGMSPDEIVSAHPGITLSQVHAALAYYYEYRDRIDADIREGGTVRRGDEGQGPSALAPRQATARKHACRGRFAST